MLLIYIHGYGNCCEKAREIAIEIFKALTRAGLSASDLQIILSLDIADKPFIEIQQKPWYYTARVPQPNTVSSYEVAKHLSDLAKRERMRFIIEGDNCHDVENLLRHH